MKKVLILAYFFPPCNLTASQRAYAWAKYLKKFGYYPIIVTRNWDNPISTPTDVLRESGTEIKHEVNSDYEVYYLPYKGSLRDRFFVKYGESQFGFFRRLLTFFEIFLENFSNRFIPFRNIYNFAKEFIKNNKDVQSLVITANPFTMFRFGYMLNKEFGIKWIADYRDDWNTSDFLKNRTLFEKVLNRIRAGSEKRWIKSAEIITSVSDAYKDKISDFVEKDGSVLYNGYFTDEIDPIEKSYPTDIFTVIYNGSLYPSQEIDIFLSAYKKLIDNIGHDKIKIQLIFPGLLFDKVEAQRVRNLSKGYEKFVHILPRIPKKEVFQMQAKAHLFLMIAHKGIKGIPSSKLYEYIGFGKPIITCPSDDDIIENTLKDYNLGYVCNDEHSALEKLVDLYILFTEGAYNTLVANQEYQQLFTREHSTKKLVELIEGFNLPEESEEMKRVLILAHDFTPYTSIGAQRPASWFKYFKSSGLYPIVVTRRWDNLKQNVVDVVKSSPHPYVSVIHSDKGTVIRVPYKPNLRDKLIIKYGLKKFNFLRRTLTLYYSIVKYLTKKADNTNIIYEEARKILLNNKIDYIIATGEPFILFKYGYLLSKEFGVRWITDYRDGWTTNPLNAPKNILEQITFKLYVNRENKYLGNVHKITTASPSYADDFHIKYPGKEVDVIYNGYDKVDTSSLENIKQNSEIFTIMYAGIFYQHQKLELFLEGFKAFIEETKCEKVQLIFLGIKFYFEQESRLLSYNKSLNNYIVTTDRLPYQEMLKQLREANLLLLLANEGANMLHAKVFDYLLVGRKIIMAQNDKGILEKILTETQSGVGLTTVDDIKNELVKDYTEFLQKGFVENNPVNIEKYSREYQAKELANLLLKS